MKKVLFGVSLLFTTLLLTGKEDKPNFLWIAVDDLNAYVGFLHHTEGNFIQKLYPDPEVRAEVRKRLSPNLDKLASMSTIFSQTYSSQALCGPSRTAMLTGVPPHISGYEDHDRHFRHHESLYDVVTLPQYLKRNGYFTTGVGKIFHKQSVNYQNGMQQDWPDRLFSWSHWVDRRVGISTEESSKIDFSPYSPADRYMRFGLTDHHVPDTFDYQNAKFVADLFANGEAKIDDLRGQPHHVALPEDQPFFLACGIFAPHMPWAVPQEYYDKFPQEEMAIDWVLREWTEKDVEDLSDFVKEVFVGGDVPMLDGMGAKVHGEGKGQLEAWRTAVQSYLATLAYADDCVGLLLDALEKSPHADNTVVILHSDHGWHLGNKYRYRKHAIWDAASHAVLTIRDPRVKSSTKGLESSKLVSLQDLYPTVVNLAGLERPDHVYGRDMSPLLTDHDKKDWDETILKSYGPGNVSVRTADYHYIRYKDGSKELYHITEDPWEYTNLAFTEPDYPALKEMDALLDERLKWAPENYR